MRIPYTKESFFYWEDVSEAVIGRNFLFGDFIELTAHDKMRDEYVKRRVYVVCAEREAEGVLEVVREYLREHLSEQKV